LTLGILALLGCAFWTTRASAQQSLDPLRVRGLIIEDANDQPRIVLGAPIANSSGRTGLRINDPAGVERLGISLQTNGSMVIGLDAPPGTGNDANRERLTFVADQSGGAHIRFLDRRTSVPARMYLDEQNRVWMEFTDYTQQPPRGRRIGLTGEENIPAGGR